MIAAGLLPIALVGFAAFSASDSERLDLPEEQEVALVNEKPVSLERFNRLLAFTVARVATKDGRIPDADALLLKKAIVEKLIDEAVTDTAAREQGLEVGEAEIDAAYEAFAQSFPTSDAFHEYVARTPDGGTAIRGDIRQRLLRERLARLDAAAAITYDEVRRYYESHPETFHQPMRVNASEVLVLHGEDAYSRAKALREKVLDGSIAFADAARQFSDGPTRAVGGARGELTEPMLDAHVWKALAALGPGQLTDVLETREGYRFLLVHEVLPALDRSFDDAWPDIQARLRWLYADSRLRTLLAELRARASIQNLFEERYADLLDDLLEPGPSGSRVSFSLSPDVAPPDPVPAGSAAIFLSPQNLSHP